MVQSPPPLSKNDPRESDDASCDLLLVEDDRRVLAFLKRQIETHGWRVATATDGLSALQVLEAKSFAAVLADESLPGPRGITVLEHARRLYPTARLILFGGWIGVDARDRARAISAPCVTKGSSESLELLLTILNET